MDLPELPPADFRLIYRNGAYYVNKPELDDTDCYTADQIREYALEAVRRERERMGLPKSYGGSTFDTWGDQKQGCTVRLHFTDFDEAERWFHRLLRSRSKEEVTDGNS